MRSTTTRHTAIEGVRRYPTPPVERVPEWRRRELVELARNGGRIIAARIISGTTVKL
jgi:hypothetical protein